MVIFESMIQGQVRYGKLSIHYSRWGNGDNVVLAIPGFGEGSESFSCIGKLMAQDQTLLAVDLPLHGFTDWKERDAIEPSALLAAIQELLFECGFINSKFSLVGFSMGARIALSIYEEAPERIKELVLLAPDGLNMHFIYWLSTQTYLGSSLFRWAMQHPESFLKTANFARRAGFLGERQLRFAKLYLQQEASRKRLYEIWTAFRKFKSRRRRISELMREHQTQLTLVFGKQDPVIQASLGEAFRRQVNGNIKIEILDCGHQLLNEKQAPQICALI